MSLPLLLELKKEGMQCLGFAIPVFIWSKDDKITIKAISIKKLLSFIVIQSVDREKKERTNPLGNMNRKERTSH